MIKIVIKIKLNFDKIPAVTLISLRWSMISSLVHVIEDFLIENILVELWMVEV